LERKESIVAGAAIALILYTLTLTVFGPTVLSALTNNKTVSNTGSVKAIGVGVYQEQACTNSVSSINWGNIEPGSNVNKTVYIRNEGDAAATLSKTQTNWNPATASTYITLNWNYTGQTLNVNAVIPVKFTLSVSSSVTGITSFSFDITITASG
jgi:hypothetical protein